jgi:FdhD protein
MDLKAKPVRTGPGLTQVLDLTQVVEWADGKVSSVLDSLAVEEPLEIRIGATPLTVTMRTPGSDLELAAGFLWTEGLIESPDQIAELSQPLDERTGKGNVVQAELRDLEITPEKLQRNFFAASSCGICGKASIEAVRVRGLRPANPNFKVDPELICSLPDQLRERQEIFGRTGGLHAAALFNGEGKLLAIREDIGRHNAVDKVVGWALLKGLLPLSEHILMTSGRGGFEIVQKAVVAGIPVVASVSAPSALAVKLARELGLTLIGFLRGRRFVMYAGHSRCLSGQS